MTVSSRLAAEARERGGDLVSVARAHIRCAATLYFAKTVLGHDRFRELHDLQIEALVGAARTAVPAPDGLDVDTVAAILTRAREIDLEEHAFSLLAESIAR